MCIPDGHAPRASGRARQPRRDGQSSRRVEGEHHQGTLIFDLCDDTLVWWLMFDLSAQSMREHV